MSNDAKARYWTAIGYPENMKENWKEEIGDILQLPYAYCVHDADVDGKEEERKVHVHIMIAYPNTTTYNNALNTFRSLNAEGKQAFNKCEKVNGVRHMYDYLIHDTDDCRKKGKRAYSPEERITGNNFDIGAYEQLSQADKYAIVGELSNVIIENDFRNFTDFYTYVSIYFDSTYLEILYGYSGFFERLTKGNYQKWYIENEKQNKS